jgi:hypothetical protein
MSVAAIKTKIALAGKLRMEKQCVRCLLKTVVFTARGAGIHKSRCEQCHDTTHHRYVYAPEKLRPLRFPVSSLKTKH